MPHPFKQPPRELDRDATYTINLEATKLIVECCKYTKVRRFVFASTCSVYGAAGDYTLNEGSLLNPVSLYAETNLHSERIVLRGFEGTHVVPTIARFATVYGASHRMRFDLVVNIMAAKAVKERKMAKIAKTKSHHPPRVSPMTTQTQKTQTPIR